MQYQTLLCRKYSKARLGLMGCEHNMVVYGTGRDVARKFPSRILKLFKTNTLNTMSMCMARCALSILHELTIYCKTKHTITFFYLRLGSQLVIYSVHSRLDSITYSGVDTTMDGPPSAHAVDIVFWSELPWLNDLEAAIGGRSPREPVSQTTWRANEVDQWL